MRPCSSSAIHFLLAVQSTIAFIPATALHGKDDVINNGGEDDVPFTFGSSGGG
jgi:hypothetical protein